MSIEITQNFEGGRQIYKNKIKESFHNNKSRDVLDKIKQMTGINEKHTDAKSLENGQQYNAND